jgi:hypothetical protein
MRVRGEDVARLRAATPLARREVLLAGSGLPGPRANLPLALAAAEVLDVREARAWVRGEVPSAGSGQREYLALCGAAAVALRTDREALRAARDRRWRVREGVALGLQRLAERDPMGFSEALDAWRGEPDPLVQRARVAAVCEPTLLADPTLAALAIEVCAEATATLQAAPDRRAEAVRVLRQTLGSGWGEAVAADPVHGLPAFRALEHDEDPDVAWIVWANRAKPRFVRLA